MVFENGRADLDGPQLTRLGFDLFDQPGARGQVYLFDQSFRIVAWSFGGNALEFFKMGFPVGHGAPLVFGARYRGFSTADPLAECQLTHANPLSSQGSAALSHKPRF